MAVAADPPGGCLVYCSYLATRAATSSPCPASAGATTAGPTAEPHPPQPRPSRPRSARPGRWPARCARCRPDGPAAWWSSACGRRRSPTSVVPTRAKAQGTSLASPDRARRCPRMAWRACATASRAHGCCCHGPTAPLPSTPRSCLRRRPAQRGMIVPCRAFEAAAEAVIRAIPPGEVMTYGEVAAEAGFPGRGARGGRPAGQGRDDLPWWRVVAANGRLVPRLRGRACPPPAGRGCGGGRRRPRPHGPPMTGDPPAAPAEVNDERSS